MYDSSKTQNPGNLDAHTINLSGGYRLFVPAKGSVFYDATGKKPINLGHVRNPAETFTPTTKKIETGVYGPLRTALEVISKTEETGTFETISSLNQTIRGLWAGSKAVEAGAPAATTFAASTEYTLGALVVPTAANGHYYEVTAAGTTSGTEPTAWKTDGGTNASGTVTFTDKGTLSSAGGGLVLIPRNHATFDGMLIDVTVSALDRPLEIYVAPAINLRGDGYGGGRNSTDETSLKFAYTILAPPAGYKVPAAVAAAFEPVAVTGGYDLLNVPEAMENTIIDAIIASYYA